MASGITLIDTNAWDEFQIIIKNISSMLEKPLVQGDVWYIVCKSWFLNFKDYVGQGNPSEEEVPNDQMHPGCIDNSELLEESDDEDIAGHLQDQVDYLLIPKELWDHLTNWFGLMDGQKPIARQVIQHGFFVPNLRIDIFPRLLLTIKRSFNISDDVKVIKFSKYISIETMDMQLRSLHKISAMTKTRFWLATSKDKFEPVRNKSTDTLEEAGFCPEQIIVWDVMNNQVGRWSNEFEPFQLPHTGSPIKLEQANYPDRQTKHDTQSSTSLLLCNQANTSTALLIPGICGLINIGNTCFMNSIVQLISNCPPITDYFLYSNYIAELNVTNPLGMRGEIAISFANLIKVLWSGNHTSVCPAEFKLKVSQFAPQFVGFAQHDAQELMTFLLDGLHEDLNRVKVKPYIQARDCSELPVNVAAQETWEYYLKRNDSIIVDNFHGMLKSTVVCPGCQKSSVTFDPFSVLSLQLPSKWQSIFQVVFVRQNAMSKPVRIRVVVIKTGCVEDLINSVSLKCNVPPCLLLVMSVTKSLVSCVYNLHHPLDDIINNDEVYVYELPLISLDVKKYILMPVCLEELGPSTTSPNEYFGQPLVVVVPRNDCNYDIIYNTLIKHLLEYVRVADSNQALNSDQRSSHAGVSDAVTGETIPILPTDNNVNDEGGEVQIEDGTDGWTTEPLFTIHLVPFRFVPTPPLARDSSSIHFAGNLKFCSCTLQWTPRAKQMFFTTTVLRDLQAFQSSASNQKNNSIPLTDCLELYIARERLGTADAWYCSTCEKHREASKKFDICRLPRVLAIHLKRFSFSQSSRRNKLDTNVTYPIRGLDLNQYILPTEAPVPKYNLIGICNHDGILNSGHYTAIVLNKNTKKWYNVDDSSVQCVQEDAIVTGKRAYVLLYVQEDIMTEYMETK